MAAKWADYVITAVRFNRANTHIDAVQIRSDNGNSAGPVQEATRAQIVNAIESGTTFCTATLSSANKWQKGAAVKVAVIDNQKFIKTKADPSKKDNLDNLPTF